MNHFKKKDLEIILMWNWLILSKHFECCNDRIDHDMIEGLDLISILNKMQFFKTFLSANNNSEGKHCEHRSVAESASD